MSAQGHSLRGGLAGTAWGRRAAEVVFRTASRRHLARLDHQAPGRCQTRILLGLLHQAQSTRFGRDHDFRRIRTVTDYRRLVPLCGREEIPPVCLSAALHAAHRAGWRTALALVADALPKARLFSGSFLMLDDAPAERVPLLLRPYTRTECGADNPVTCAAGPAERLVPLINEMRAQTGKGLDVLWPDLAAVLYTTRSPATVERLRSAVGPGVLLLETVWGEEGPIAVEDPRHGMLRLLPDHGLYFEFVPLGSPDQAPRLGLDEIELNVHYELVLTSPAGLWACRLGRAVCLQRRDLPLVRFVEMPPAAVAAPPRHEITIPTPPPHRQSAGTPAVPPGSFVHSPWSTLAGRG